MQLVQHVKAIVADIQFNIAAAVLFLAFEVGIVLGMAAYIVQIAVKVVSQGGIDKHIGGLLAGSMRGNGYFMQDIIGIGVYHHLYSDVIFLHFVEVNVHKSSFGKGVCSYILIIALFVEFVNTGNNTVI